MWVLLLIISLASAQQCPYCDYNACTVNSNGVASCSQCSSGTLIQVQTLNNFSYPGQTIGICQLCPTGCLNCQYTMLSPSMSPAFMALNCTTCAQAYTYNYYTGNCVACSAGCSTCLCETSGCSIVCTACSSGYSLSGMNCIATTVALQETQTSTIPSTSSSSTSSVTIGLSVWGAVMTVASSKNSSS